ncbi:TetR/AcrR family transcriptional regulator [Amycolatopsis endophytica]|uniref:AcrR family transcriptional regulator n=1 Tax=Amycolatopsis endophytica TaxID=860233 RepID=A0A853BC37_9PSEU|nr:TetR/AcrR family transcriptional regulator [Amycolatopsis endophytica]NYI92314.1 AcrR family transcriptional regulator [Amycolatopsis endophytica]
MTSQASTSSRTRRDSVRNRQRIIDTARAALAADGDVSMHAIAKAAGIGQGTLYRHFPTRETLVLAVHREDVAALVRAAPELLTEHPPVVALRKWLEMLARYGRIKHGLSGAFYAATHAQLAEEGYQPVVGAIGALLAAGTADGTVRDDITAEELLLLVGFLWRVEVDANRDKRVATMLDVVLNGLFRQN